MSHFYGSLQGSRGEATRCATKKSGLTVRAAGWGGSILVRVWHDTQDGVDCFSVHQTLWQGAGVSEAIASGILGQTREKE